MISCFGQRSIGFKIDLLEQKAKSMYKMISKPRVNNISPFAFLSADVSSADGYLGARDIIL